jgi:general secretion pathway protein K
LLSTIAAALSTETRGDARIARNIADSAMARASADAGVERGILDLLDSHGGQQLDAVKFTADGTPHAWYFGDSAIVISVTDELGKLNLNQASEAHLAALFEAVGVNPGKAVVLADAIADFRDPDKAKHLQGAEEADYLAAGYSVGPKDAPFESLEELQRVFGMTPEIYEQVAPFLTLYSIGNTVNPDRADGRLTAALRRAGYNYFVTAPGTAYSIRAAATHASGAVFVREAVVQVMPDTPTPVRVLSWRQGR